MKTTEESLVRILTFGFNGANTIIILQVIGLKTQNLKPLSCRVCVKRDIMSRIIMLR